MPQTSNEPQAITEPQTITAQVFVFGHKLSPETTAWLEAKHGQGCVRVHKAFVQIDVQNEHEVASKKVLQRLRAQGADLTGATLTYMTVHGLSTTSLALAAVIAGVSGRMPRVLNLIRMNDHETEREFYAPSPELPYVDLESLKNLVGRAARAKDLEGVSLV